MLYYHFNSSNVFVLLKLLYILTFGIIREGLMKKPNKTQIGYIIFTLAFAEIIGLGLASFFNSIDLEPHYRHPIFGLFCKVIATFSFITFIILLIVNMAFVDKLNYTVKAVALQILCIILLIIPFIYLNGALLNFIHKIFASPECWDFNKYH